MIDLDLTISITCTITWSLKVHFTFLGSRDNQFVISYLINRKRLLSNPTNFLLYFIIFAEQKNQLL